MIIPIKTNMNMFFVVLLTLMNKFPPIKGLPKRELEVLGEFMYQNYKYKHVDIKKRHFLIFSTDNRIEMRERLGMSEGSLNDYISRLRKKGILSDSNQMLPFLNIIPDKNYELNIKFTIHE
jgi:hypothetical protein